MTLLRLCLSLMLAASVAAAGDVPASGGEPAQAMARRMGRGLNILGYDGVWDGGIDAPFRKSDFAAIRTAGFSHVRINLHAFKYMRADGTLDPRVLEGLDWAVGQSLAHGLIPVVDEHDFSDCQSDPDGCSRKLRLFWRQISAHFAGRFPDLVFELLNEPGGNLSASTWNGMVRELLAIIRVAHPTRIVIVATINSEEVESIRALDLPARDRALIVTVHYYKPFRFTHQGAAWAGLGDVRNVEWGSAADVAAVRADFATVQAWAERERRPVYLGEFGVYEAAGLERRARWMNAISREAERHGWAWAAWQYDHDFALVEMNSRRWKTPLLRALIPVPAPPCSPPQANGPRCR